MKQIKGETEKEWMSEMSSGVNFPTMWIDESEIPEAMDWEVGKEYELKIKVRMTSKNQRQGAEGEVGLDIIAYEYIDTAKEDPSDPKKPGSIYGYKIKK